MNIILENNRRQISPFFKIDDRFKLKYAYKKKIYDVLEIDFESGLIKIFHDEMNNIVFADIKLGKLLQCVGINDKAGSPLFEGDILKDLRDGSLFRIAYNNYTKEFGIIALKIGASTYYDKRMATELNKIGNIYEKIEGENNELC